MDNKPESDESISFGRGTELLRDRGQSRAGIPGRPTDGDYLIIGGRIGIEPFGHVAEQVVKPGCIGGALTALLN